MEFIQCSVFIAWCFQHFMIHFRWNMNFETGELCHPLSVFCTRNFYILFFFLLNWNSYSLGYWILDIHDPFLFKVSNSELETWIFLQKMNEDKKMLKLKVAGKLTLVFIQSSWFCVSVLKVKFNSLFIRVLNFLFSEQKNNYFRN